MGYERCGWGQFAVVMCLIVLGMVDCRPPQGPPPQGPPEVVVVSVFPERVELHRELPGHTVPFRVAEIRPQVNGILKERFFEEGADVEAGSLLYQIDSAPYQSAYDQARAALEMAEASLPAARSRAERLKEMVAIHAAGQQEYDDAAGALLSAEARVSSARAAMESARINLEYTPIRAPISGRIGRSSVTVGALLAAYQPMAMAVIQQLDPIYVDVTQSSAELLRLREAVKAGILQKNGDAQNRVELILESDLAYPLEGTFQFQEVSVDPGTGSVTLRMVFPNPEHGLLPGMFVRAVIQEGVIDEAFLIPQQGVMRDFRGEPYVWVVDEQSVVQQRALKIDRAMGNRWLVTDGLVSGDRLIVEGLQRVRPGVRVKVTSRDSQQGSGSTKLGEERSSSDRE